MKIFYFLGLLFIPYGIFAQSIKGQVSNINDEYLIGANVHWADTSVGISTNYKGEFEINTIGKAYKKLVASYVGYESDTLLIINQTFVQFNLKPKKSEKEVTITGQKDGLSISDISPIKVENISSVELTKAACCDLAGCFETQLTVQSQTTNVITNSKELRILGLSGVYNQILIDGFPLIQGLSYTYGISGIPGTLVENIYVAKGANSVLQGYESISGQINVTTKDPDKTDKLLLNVYMNSFSEKQFNANYALKKGKWSNLTAVHAVQPARVVDRDHDNFMDLPLLTRYLVFNKLKYGQEKDWGWSSIIGLRFLNEQRIGGQTQYKPETDKGSTKIYGQSVNINHPEMYAKTSYRLNDKHRLSLFVSSFYQDQKSYFGTVQYFAKQSNVYTNLQYETEYKKSNSLKIGLSYRYLNLQENLAFTDTLLKRTYAGDYKRLEKIPGAFAENTMQFFKKKLTWITGVRGDQHNQFGFTATPRTLVKFDIRPKTVIRANIGTGWRTVNLFSENIGLLVSSRDLVFAEQLKPERATNMGINLTQKFELKYLSGYFSVDYYRTDFQNQIFPDYDTDPQKAIIKNFNGNSVSNGFQAEFFVKIWKRFEFKTGYTKLDVYRMVNGEKILLPFNPEHKILSTFSYKPLSSKFHFDINFHWYGKQRLPNTQANPVEFQRPDFSKPYSLINAQLTYKFKKLEIYGGCENIFNFRQNQPIVSWQNPNSPYFDTSSVWGPTRGREIYGGLRYIIENK